jgi:hypothetical protein
LKTFKVAGGKSYLHLRLQNKISNENYWANLAQLFAAKEDCTEAIVPSASATSVSPSVAKLGPPLLLLATLALLNL